MILIYISIAFSLAWLAVGALAAGYYFAHMQRYWRGFGVSGKHRFEDDKEGALVTLVAGPIALLELQKRGYTEHGWLWPWSKKARREAGL